MFAQGRGLAYHPMVWTSTPRFGKTGRVAKVLVVDDYEPMRRMVVRILAREDHDVVEADSAEAARTAIAANDFDLLLVDLILPGVSGVELVTGLDSPPPVVFISGEATEQLVDHPRALEHALLIQKPFDPGQLLETLALALARRPR
jgi:DNA-binding response OmpR family regulator